MCKLKEVTMENTIVGYGTEAELQKFFYDSLVKAVPYHCEVIHSRDIQHKATLLARMGFNWSVGAKFFQGVEFLKLGSQFHPEGLSPLQQPHAEIVELCGGLALAEIGLFGPAILRSNPKRLDYLSHEGLRMFRLASNLEKDQNKAITLKRTAEHFHLWVEIMTRTNLIWHTNDRFQRFLYRLTSTSCFKH
jgi:hypothetical protein